MYELLALSIGAVTGWFLRHVDRKQRVAAVVGATALVGSILVGIVSGELEISLGFLILDGGQIVVAALLVRAFARLAFVRGTRTNPHA